MAAAAEPFPWDDDELPDAVIDAGLAAHDAAIWGRDDEELGGWIDDALSAEIDAELAACTERDADQPGWAVPGLGSVEDGGGLSARSAAVLAETAAAASAVRLAQARFYRALAALEASEAVAESGYRHTSRLLAEHVRLDTAEATRLARHAHSLTPAVSPTGAEVPAALPATANHVHAGVIGPGHVEVIRRTMARLAAVTPALAEHVLATTETELAELATTRTPAALAEAATAILALLDPDGTAPDDQPPPENELHYLRRRNGSLVGRFTYRDPAAADTLHTALTVATPPPDPIPDPTAEQRAGTAPRGYSAEAYASQTLPERRAHALLDLAGEALTHGLNIPDHSEPGDRPGDDDDEDTTSWGLFPDHDPPAPPDDTAHHDSHGDDPNDADTNDADTNDADTNNADTNVDGNGNGDTGGDERADDQAGCPADAADGAAQPPPDDPPPPEPPPAGGAAPPRWTRADLEGGERVALTLTLNYDTLRAALTTGPHRDGHCRCASSSAGSGSSGRDPGDGFTGRLALLGENTWIRPGTARRLACDAELIPVVLGSKGEVLDLGRKNRLVSLALRRAVIHRDRHCAHPGCRRRARRCQVHHIQAWADGGETCLQNCVLLCSYHHSLVHHSDWQIHMIDGLPWFTPPAYIDPQRRPRHNRPWQPHTEAAA